MNVFKRAWLLRKEPIIADHKLDLMCLFMWFIYGLWGILSTVQNVTILKETLSWYPIVWGSFIGMFSLIAFIGCLMLFAVKREDFNARIRWKEIELMAVSVLLVIVMVYPLLMFIGLFDGSPRIDLFVLSMSYLAVPAWRVGHLRARINGLQILRAQTYGR